MNLSTKFHDFLSLFDCVLIYFSSDDSGLNPNQIDQFCELPYFEDIFCLSDPCEVMKPLTKDYDFWSLFGWVMVFFFQGQQIGNSKIGQVNFTTVHL